jgi:hypothetical protein
MKVVSKTVQIPLRNMTIVISSRGLFIFVRLVSLISSFSPMD